MNQTVWKKGGARRPFLFVLRTMLFRSLALLPLTLALGAPCRAQDDAAVPRPQIHAGDSWTYRRTDYVETGQRSFGETVTFANERVIQVIHKPQGTEKEIDATFTAEWNAVSSPNTGIYDPDQGLLRFPLHPGDTHDASYDIRFPRQGAYEVKQQRHVKVIGWEAVKVPAGTFRALRVESEGTWYRVDLGVSGGVKEVMWYSPQVKRYVKWSFDNWSPSRGRLQSWAWELVDYHVQ